MLRLCTYYTPTHREMCQRFVLSRAYGFHEVRSVEYEQTCPTGAFKSEGWNRCMTDKLDCLMRLPMDGTPTVYVDADVCLMPGLHDWAERQFAEMDFDGVAMSDDIVQWCAGVMLFRSTSRVHAWWRLVADLSAIWDLPDQEVIDQLRQHSQQRGTTLPVPLTLLPCDRVCNWATVSQPNVPPPWTGEPFEVPPTCVAWHANWTVGVERKVEMLERVLHGWQHRSN